MSVRAAQRRLLACFRNFNDYDKRNRPACGHSTASLNEVQVFILNILFVYSILDILKVVPSSMYRSQDFHNGCLTGLAAAISTRYITSEADFRVCRSPLSSQRLTLNGALEEQICGNRRHGRLETLLARLVESVQENLSYISVCSCNDRRCIYVPREAVPDSFLRWEARTAGPHPIRDRRAHQIFTAQTNTSTGDAGSRTAVQRVLCGDWPPVTAARFH